MVRGASPSCPSCLPWRPLRAGSPGLLRLARPLFLLLFWVKWLCSGHSLLTTRQRELLGVRPHSRGRACELLFLNVFMQGEPPPPQGESAWELRVVARRGWSPRGRVPGVLSLEADLRISLRVVDPPDCKPQRVIYSFYFSQIKKIFLSQYILC